MPKIPHALGDAPIEDKHRDLMRATAVGLDRIFNGEDKGKDREVGFVLMVYPFNEHDGRCNFISNGADRKDLIVLFKEMIARFEGQPEQSGSA